MKMIASRSTTIFLSLVLLLSSFQIASAQKPDIPETLPKPEIQNQLPESLLLGNIGGLLKCSLKLPITIGVSFGRSVKQVSPLIAQFHEVLLRELERCSTGENAVSCNTMKGCWSQSSAIGWLLTNRPKNITEIITNQKEKIAEAVDKCSAKVSGLSNQLGVCLKELFISKGTIVGSVLDQAAVKLSGLFGTIQAQALEKCFIGSSDQQSTTTVSTTTVFVFREVRSNVIVPKGGYSVGSTPPSTPTPSTPPPTPDSEFPFKAHLFRQTQQLCSLPTVTSCIEDTFESLTKQTVTELLAQIGSISVVDIAADVRACLKKDV